MDPPRRPNRRSRGGCAGTASTPTAAGSAPTIRRVQQASGATRFRDLTLAEFVRLLSSTEPVPGGGSAAAISASLGAALLAMVASLSLGREQYARYSETLEQGAETGRRLATRFLDLADDDAAAYGAFAAALKSPRGTEAERTARADTIKAAARRAAEVPLETIEACLILAESVELMAGRSNAHASSDLSVAALFADAAAQAAANNVLTNLPAADDPDWAVEMTARVVELLAAVDSLARMTREIVGSGEVREPVPAASEG